MPDEARLEDRDEGQIATTDGWYVLHTADAQWFESEKFGSVCRLEGEVRFPHIGINIRVLEPGQPACLYHRENAQENFLVLSGECTLLIEGEERALEAGHFVHCPAETNHVFVGAGDRPCTILMIGYRPDDWKLCYPVSELAEKYGASAVEETTDPKTAYSAFASERVPGKALWP
jgi:uncharacterized cupin superfamily protein